MKTEIRKSLSGWQFWATLGVLCCITLFCAMFVINAYNDETNLQFVRDGFERNPYLPMNTLFNRWIGAEWMSPLSSIFFFVFPLCAVIPYGLSFYQERRSGYMAQMVLRETRGKYLCNKIIAVFLSGGLVITLPVVLNIMAVAMFIPAYKPDLNYDIYYAVQPFSFGSELFYSTPWLYLVLRVATIFLYAGLAASMSFAITFLTRNRFVILFSPMIFFLLLNYSYTLFPVIYEISPLRFLGAGNICLVSTFVVVGEALILFISVITVVLLMGRKKDVL